MTNQTEGYVQVSLELTGHRHPRIVLTSMCSLANEDCFSLEIAEALAYRVGECLLTSILGHNAVHGKNLSSDGPLHIGGCRWPRTVDRLYDASAMNIPTMQEREKCLI